MDRERITGLGGWYSPAKDSTRLSAYAGAPRPTEAVYTHITFAGRGPYSPVGLPLGFTFTGSTAKGITRDSATYPVTILTEPESLRLDLGLPVITPLDKTGSSPATTVNAIVTRAALLALVRSTSATVLWKAYRIRLGSHELGVIRALYRAALCAPAGIPDQPS